MQGIKVQKEITLDRNKDYLKILFEYDNNCSQ